jgi:hypothetical protein
MPALSGFSKSSRVRFRPYDRPKRGHKEIPPSAHEEQILAKDVGEGDSVAGIRSSAPADFRNQLDVGVCTCVGEEKCVLCCTEFDLAAIPKSPGIERQHLAKKPNDVNLFYVTMPLDLALRLGFITEEALDSE